MSKSLTGLVFAISIVITIVGADLIFFRHHTAQRLIANIGIVLIYIAFYWKAVRK